MIDVEERISAARASLVLDARWYGVGAMRLRSIVDESVKTAITDGTSVRWNPAYVATLDSTELKSVWAHEVLHCVLRHPWRVRGWDPELANQAADYVVNRIISQDSRLRLPEGALLDPQFGDDWDLSRVYAYLRDQRAKQQPPPPPEPEPQDEPGDDEQDDEQDGQPSDDGEQDGDSDQPSDDGEQDGDQDQDGQPGDDANDENGPGNDGGRRPGGMGDIEAPPDAAKGDGQGQADAPDMSSEGDWALFAEQMNNAMRSAGLIPGGAEREINAAKVPPQDWREILKPFITNALPTDQSWSRPNRRYLAAANAYLPGWIKESVGTIGVAVDTSGSVSQEMLNAFAAVLTEVAAEAQPEALRVVYCDAYINGPEQRFEPGDEIKLEARGGGGTRFQPVFDHFEEDPPLAVIYLTDLLCYDRPRDPGYPVLWAVPGWSREQPPGFGEVLRVTY